MIRQQHQPPNVFSVFPVLRRFLKFLGHGGGASTEARWTIRDTDVNEDAARPLQTALQYLCIHNRILRISYAAPFFIAKSSFLSSPVLIGLKAQIVSVPTHF